MATDHVIIGDLPDDITDETLKTNFEAYGTIKWCKVFNGKGGGAKSAIIEFGSVDEATWLVENLDGNVPLGLETEVTVKYKPAKNAGKGGDRGKNGQKAQAENRSTTFGNKGAGKAATPAKGTWQPKFNKTESHNEGGFAKGGKGGQVGKPWKAAGGGGGAGIREFFKGLMKQKALPGGTWANDERTICLSGLPSDTTENDLYKIFAPFGPILPGGVTCTMNADGTAKGTGMVNFASLESTELAIQTLHDAEMPDGSSLQIRQFSQDGKGGRKGGKGKRGKGKQQEEEDE